MDYIAAIFFGVAIGLMMALFDYQRNHTRVCMWCDATKNLTQVDASKWICGECARCSGEITREF